MIFKRFYLYFCLSFFCYLFQIEAADMLFLKENLQQARPGDYIVVSINKTDTLMHIYSRENNLLTLEEISIPEDRRKNFQGNWKEWVNHQAPGNTSWVMYEIDVQTGQMLRYYSFSKGGWFEIPEADNFLGKLLNLRLTKVPENMRKRVGPKPAPGSPDYRSFWQPRMIVDGKTIKNVKFDAWRTKWPKDSSDLSGRTIEVFLPQESQRYPSYFPYWLQISAPIGKAKIRIIDSGNGLKSPKPSLNTLASQH